MSIEQEIFDVAVEAAKKLVARAANSSAESEQIREDAEEKLAAAQSILKMVTEAFEERQQRPKDYEDNKEEEEREKNDDGNDKRPPSPSTGRPSSPSKFNGSGGRGPG